MVRTSLVVEVQHQQPKTKSESLEMQQGQPYFFNQFQHYTRSDDGIVENVNLRGRNVQHESSALNDDGSLPSHPAYHDRGSHVSSTCYVQFLFLVLLCLC
jgi:hypothetical protein